MAESSSVNPLPPPWGLPVDPHFTPQKAGEGLGYHTQVTAEQATLNGWFFRSEWYKRLVPDTRKCARCGQQLFQEAELTEEQIAVLYRYQENGMATGPIG